MAKRVRFSRPSFGFLRATSCTALRRRYYLLNDEQIDLDVIKYLSALEESRLGTQKI